MNKTVGIKLVQILMVSQAALYGASAMAQPLNETYVDGITSKVPTVRVQFAANDLDSAAGREALIRRIEKASSLVCGPMDLRRAGGMSRVTRNRACYEEALGQAMSQIDGLQKTAAIAH